jgi:predicted DNA-binding transcriptional regulator YafY
MADLPERLGRDPRGEGPMSPTHTKAERLLEIEVLLLAHPAGMRQADLAARLGVHRSTIHRYLPELTTQFQVFETDDGRLAIDRDNYLARLRVTVHEAAAIFLAARLLHRTSDEHNPHAAEALTKLGCALQGVAPPMAAGIVKTAEAMSARGGRASDSYLPVLRALTTGWVTGRWVRVRYRRIGAEVESQSMIAPYLLEATAPGFSTYCVGLREPPGEVRTLKIERITHAEVTQEPYEIPDDFDASTRFDRAWGVWVGCDSAPVEVVLRFAAAAAERVRETRWHASESANAEPDGSVTWRACVDEPTEMLPWIRSWGADVEVIAPEALRRQVAEGHRLAAEHYAATGY